MLNWKLHEMFWAQQASVALGGWRRSFAPPSMPSVLSFFGDWTYVCLPMMYLRACLAAKTKRDALLPRGLRVFDFGIGWMNDVPCRGLEYLFCLISQAGRVPPPYHAFERLFLFYSTQRTCAVPSLNYASELLRDCQPGRTTPPYSSFA